MLHLDEAFVLTKGTSQLRQCNIGVDVHIAIIEIRLRISINRHQPMLIQAVGEQPFEANGKWLWIMTFLMKHTCLS